MWVTSFVYGEPETKDGMYRLEIKKYVKNK